MFKRTNRKLKSNDIFYAEISNFFFTLKKIDENVLSVNEVTYTDLKTKI